MDRDNQSLRSWREAQDLKDQLLHRASIGDLSDVQADAEAERLGLGRLSREPGSDEFRAEDQSHWTLPMAIAWVAYLCLDDVREWSAPYRAECFDWHWHRWRTGPDGPIKEGWHLQQRAKPTLALLGISAAFDRAEGEKALHMSIREAREALWIALREGFFTASGIGTETNRRVEIPTLEWHELVAVEGRGEVDEVWRGMRSTGYRDVLVPSVAVRGFWRRPVERVERLPPTIRPDGDGFMPLYCGAQWIATQGGTLDFPPNDPPRWRAAYAILLSAITSDKVRVVGLKGSEREVIAGHIFAGIQVDYPFEDPELNLLVGTELYLRSYPYLDEEHWRGGFDDALIQKREDKWTRLMVDKTAVRQLWPFDDDSGAVDQRTGLPGRPGKGRNLIEDELRRRAFEGRLAPSLSQEVNELLAWLRDTHSGVPRPASGTTKNNIREEYRRLKEGTK